jgi:Gas vesicle synthesis protein GvpO
MADASNDGRLSARELGDAALETVQDLTGYQPEAVTGLEWDGEYWQVTVDVLELSRIPSTTDVLATYVVQLDEGGSLHGYRRTARFARGQVAGD